ncbi:prepilin-type N-terminal cleavage/methylation domain-containing protein [Evansella sp. LMS18]|uniref:PilW family protein n=1 Tax=Evansella sp. LMS18 TaxID=2924033 RepID=UPI0020D04435|nr:prepilin-type N-terminal cleavage/methylation domain-containing protein [Evansella sp. LMS18]UTR11249.1 prepilin-type N-terminal cleavage/methylation domain-containing protein [Evansella sp. LMS18]
MLKKLQDNRGVTLVEVLVSTALLSMILLVITSFHLFGQNQFINQKSHSDSVTNVRLAMSDMTKEIRKGATVTDCGYEELTVGDNSYNIEINSSNGEYRLVKYGTNPLEIGEIKSFECKFIKTESENLGVNIEITGTQPGQSSPVSHSSRIYFRK